MLFHLPNWSFAIFNLADAFITVGATLIVLEEFIGWRREKRLAEQAGSARQGGARIALAGGRNRCRLVVTGKPAHPALPSRLSAVPLTTSKLSIPGRSMCGMRFDQHRRPKPGARPGNP